VPYTRRYDRWCVIHAAAVNLATWLVSDFNISSERTRAWFRFLFNYELVVSNLFYHLMYCWFRRNWNNWKASSKFHTTPLIRFLLRHAQEGNKCTLHCTACICYRQQIKLDCVNKPLHNTVYRTCRERIGDVRFIQRPWSRRSQLQWGEII
jgi:amino acid permease